MLIVDYTNVCKQTCCKSAVLQSREQLWTVILKKTWVHLEQTLNLKRLLSNCPIRMNDLFGEYDRFDEKHFLWSEVSEKLRTREDKHKLCLLISQKLGLIFSNLLQRTHNQQHFCRLFQLASGLNVYCKDKYVLRKENFEHFSCSHLIMKIIIVVAYLPSPYPPVHLAAARRLSVAAACGGGGSCWQLLLWLW